MVIAHKLSIIKKADHILAVDQGQIVEEETHQKLIANEGKYAVCRNKSNN